jgi:hypothetical protein
MRGRDVVQVERLGDRDRQGAVGGRSGEVGRSLPLGVSGEVVAAQETDRDVVVVLDD